MLLQHCWNTKFSSFIDLIAIKNFVISMILILMLCLFWREFWHLVAVELMQQVSWKLMIVCCIKQWWVLQETLMYCLVFFFIFLIYLSITLSLSFFFSRKISFSWSFFLLRLLKNMSNISGKLMMSTFFLIFFRSQEISYDTLLIMLLCQQEIGILFIFCFT